MTKQLSSKDRMQLLNFLKANAQRNSTLEELRVLTAQFGMEQPMHRVQYLAVTLRRIAPELFDEAKRRPAMKADDIRRLAEEVRSHIKVIDPSAAAVHAAVEGLGHTISVHAAKLVAKSLKENAPELFSEQWTEDEIRDMADFLKPHISVQNPTYDLLQEIAAKFGRTMSYKFSQHVRAELRIIEPSLFTKESRQRTSRTKRRMLRLNVNEADYVIYTEFVEMMGLTQVESISVLARALVYLTVTQNINLVQILSAAKKMTNVEAAAYSTIFSKLDLLRI